MRTVWFCTILVGLTGMGCIATRAGYQTAPYRLLSTDGRFEIRDYPRLQLASVPSGKGFMSLFRYISGKNAQAEKIAMTTPVLVMGESSEMAFVLPERYGHQAVPSPKDESVQIREVPPTRFAVFRYAGGDSPSDRTHSLEQLIRWLETARLQSEGEPLYAFFDPPWVPSFWRRNEVMLRLKPNLP